MVSDTPFSAEEAHDSPGFLLWQVTSLWQRRISAALRPHDLTQVQFALLASILWLAQRQPAISQVALARHAKLDVMMTSQVLRTLEGRGLITRDVHPEDPRAKALSLTRAGTTLAWLAIPVVEQADREFFAALGKRQSPFMDDLRRLINAAG